MKNKLPVQIMVLPLLIIFIIGISNIAVLAQGDNPLVDHVPQEWIENINYSDSEEDVITDSDGYDNFNLGVDFAEPHVTQNPNSPEQYFGGYNINGAWRTSDGHNWLHSTPPFGTSVNGDPCTAYDGSGNLYYESMYGGIQGCKVIRSTDNGSTWSSAVTSIFGGDKNWMAADQTTGPYSGYVYTTMTRSSFNGHGFARTTNSGSTWTTTFNASNSPLPGAMVCVGPNGATDGGSVYFVTNTGNAFASVYGFYVSTNGGANFTFQGNQSFAGYVGSNVNGRNSVQNMRTRPYPFIAADQSNGTYRGRLYCVYACRYSTNQGSTWSSPVVVNDDASTTNHNQWHPSIWCDKQTGRLFVKWMDTRDTPASDYAYIYASFSDDGGVTWATNQRISNQKMRINCTSCGGGGTPRYQGDYDAIISLDGQSLAVWTDFRDGSFGSYVSYFPDFAMTVSPSSLEIEQDNDIEFITISVPEVKLYSQNAIFSATVTPTPDQGTITLDFPSGNTLSSFPGTVSLRITTSGNVTLGEYVINMQGEGPNGTPVHRRTSTLTVTVPVPVELVSFNGKYFKNQVLLDWETATEVDNYGFNIERVSLSTSPGEEEWETIGFVEGHGNSNSPKKYSYIDKNPVGGSNFKYRLKQIDTDGKYEYSDIVEIEIVLSDFALYQNYPNPFNPSTTIKYSIPSNVKRETSKVSLKVYDALGDEIVTLVDEEKEAGIYEVDLNSTIGSRQLASCIYFYQFRAGNFVDTKKMILLR